MRGDARVGVCGCEGVGARCVCGVRRARVGVEGGGGSGSVST